MTTIYIATPCYGGNILMRCAKSIMQTCIMAERAKDVNVVCLFTEGESLVQRARNQLVHQFLTISKSGDKLLFIDADLEFDPEWVFMLNATGRDVVGLAYPRKRIEWDDVKGADDPQMAAASYFIHPETADGKPVQVDNGCIPVRWLGTGFMMITRECILSMCREYSHTAHISDSFGSAGEIVHALFDCAIDEKDGIYLSEDYLFCQRWRSMGNRVWMGLWGSPSHVGNHTFRGNLGKLIQPAGTK